MGVQDLNLSYFNSFVLPKLYLACFLSPSLRCKNSFLIGLLFPFCANHLATCMSVCSIVSDSLHPIDCSPSSSYVHGISQERILKWVIISFFRDLPNPGIKPKSPGSPALASMMFTTEPPETFLSHVDFSFFITFTACYKFWNVVLSVSCRCSKIFWISLIHTCHCLASCLKVFKQFQSLLFLSLS